MTNEVMSSHRHTPSLRWMICSLESRIIKTHLYTFLCSSRNTDTSIQIHIPNNINRCHERKIVCACPFSFSSIRVLFSHSPNSPSWIYTMFGLGYTVSAFLATLFLKSARWMRACEKTQINRWRANALCSRNIQTITTTLLYRYTGWILSKELINRHSSSIPFVYSFTCWIA